MAIEQMQRQNKHTHLPASDEIFDHLCVTLQANANLSFTHMLTITFSAWVYTRETIRKWSISQICVQLFILTSMRSYPMRLVLVLRCTFAYHHALCLLIAVALLSMCRFAGSFKHFVHVQKAYCKCSTYFWAFSKGPGQLVLI